MSLGQKTLTGVLWQGLQVLITRAANLVCQLVLTYLLVPQDFGVVTAAISVLAIAAVASDFGTGRLLVRRKKRFDQWVGPAAAFTLGSSLLIAGVLAALAWPLAHMWFHAPEVTWMIVVLAIDLPLRALMVPSRVGLQVDMRFRELSRVQIIQGVFMVACAITLAAALPKGQRAWSMIWPAPLTSLLGVVLFWRIKPVAFWEKLRLGRIKHLLADSAGIALYSIVAQFIYYGDNLMLGRFQESKEPLGQYRMAYTLAVQMVNLVANSLSMVLFPALASVKHDKAKLQAAWLNAMRLLGLVAFPACLIQIPLADPVIRLVLPANWVSIIPMVQALSFGVAVRAAGVLVEPLMFAAGRLRLMLVIGVLQAASVLVAAAIGANYFDATHAGLAVAVGVAIAYVLMYTYAIILCAREVNLPWWRPLAVLAKPFVGACLACGAAWSLARVPWPHWPVGFTWRGRPYSRDLGLLLECTAMAALAGGLYFALARRFMRAEMNDLLRRIRGVRGGPKAAVAVV